MLLSLASSLNSVPLPPILDRYGLKLPPPQHCLTNVNFSLVPNPPPEASSDGDAPGEDEDEDEDAVQVAKGSDGEGEQGDESMVDSTAVVGDADMGDVAVEPRGTKRNLDEDEDYD